MSEADGEAYKGQLFLKNTYGSTAGTGVIYA